MKVSKIVVDIAVDIGISRVIMRHAYMYDGGGHGKWNLNVTKYLELFEGWCL